MATLANRLANLIQAIENCANSGNVEWQEKHTENAKKLVREHLPTGSGFDVGTKLRLDRSSAELLVFETQFHHMNDGGMYDGWTYHFVRVRASLIFGLDITISGRNRNDIKDLIHQEFDAALSADIPG